nr:Zinc finger CDGSH-type protein [uncultured bacterium]
MYGKGGPYMVAVDDGEHVTVCQCGASETPPFCSGQHTMTRDAALPLKFTARSGGKIAICGCGKSRNMPWCDISHGRGSCSGKHAQS